MPALLVMSLARGLVALRARWDLAVHHLALVATVRRERAALVALDDRLLADIGVSREAAVAEAMRDPYDLPRDRCPQCDDRVAMPASAMALMRPLS